MDRRSRVARDGCGDGDEGDDNVGERWRKTAGSDSDECERGDERGDAEWIGGKPDGDRGERPRGVVRAAVDAGGVGADGGDGVRVRVRSAVVAGEIGAVATGATRVVVLPPTVETREVDFTPRVRDGGADAVAVE